MKFANWINTFNAEKGIDLEQRFDVEGPTGTNSFSYGVVIEHMLIASPTEQAAIKTVIVKIDFVNGDVTDFYKYLAKAIAV